MSTIAEDDGLDFDLYQNHRFQIVWKCFGLRELPARGFCISIPYIYTGVRLISLTAFKERQAGF